MHQQWDNFYVLSMVFFFLFFPFLFFIYYGINTFFHRKLNLFKIKYKKWIPASILETWVQPNYFIPSSYQPTTLLSHITLFQPHIRIHFTQLHTTAQVSFFLWSKPSQPRNLEINRYCSPPLLSWVLPCNILFLVFRLGRLDLGLFLNFKFKHAFILSSNNVSNLSQLKGIIFRPGFNSIIQGICEPNGFQVWDDCDSHSIFPLTSSNCSFGSTLMW